MSDFANIYQRFLNLASAVDEMSEFPSLDPTEKYLLRKLSKFWVGNEKITVVETMHITDDISTSTIFRYLKKLRAKGYIELKVDEIDNRVKYVSPTKLTNAYFSKMGKVLVTASTK